MDAKRKHEKKEKKDKKSKRSKKEKKKEKKSSKREISQDEPVVMGWVEKKVIIPGEETDEKIDSPIENESEKEEKKTLQRESWMTAPPSRLFSSTPSRETQSEKPKETLESPKIEPVKAKEEAKEDQPLRSVGDGGRGWRSRIHRLEEEEAVATGRPVEAVAATRRPAWEDLGTPDPSLPPRAPRMRTPGMRAPSSNSLRWKRDREDRDSYGERDRREKDREYDRRREKDREYDRREKDREYDRREKDREYDKRREREEERIDGGERKRSKLETDEFGRMPQPHSLDSDSTTAPKPDSDEMSTVAEQPPVSQRVGLTRIPTGIPDATSANRSVADALRARLRGEDVPLPVHHLTVAPSFDAEGRPLLRARDAREPTAPRGRGKGRGRYRDAEETSDNLTVEELVAREKIEGRYSSRYDEAFARTLGARGTSKTLSLDEMDEVSDQMSNEMWDASRKQKRKGKRTQEQKQLQRAIQAERRAQQELDSCWFCWTNPQLDKRLLLSLGDHSYLAIPKRGRLVPGHCLIIPMGHVKSLTSADEELWEDIQRFRQSLTRMFRSQKQEPIFLETVIDVRRGHHTFLECVPLPQSLAVEAPMYFKKAILESESEWAQHRKLIDTTGKGIRRSIPEGFPYFAVDFGNDSGFAHVIENERKFPRDFGRGIIAGMLELDPEEWMRPQNETPESLQKYLREFLPIWTPFDWTAE